MTRSRDAGGPLSTRRCVRLGFADFYPGFCKRDNWFTHLLGKYYDVAITDDPDYLIFSTYGNEHLRYGCSKIFYTAENVRPDFDHCDWAFGFDFLEDPRHYRLPLYPFYADVDELTKPKPPAEQILAGKRHFCCMVVSNPKGQERTQFFHQLSKYKQVHSGGWYLNNIGGPVPKTIDGKPGKVEFIRKYKFVIAFENESYPGYTTEKIFEPMLVHSIPIYWGNPRVDQDFNPKSFVNCHDYRNFEEVIERIIEIDTDETEYWAVMEQPYFVGNIPNEYVQNENILKQFHRIFSAPRERSLRRVISSRLHRSRGPLSFATRIKLRHFSNPVRSAESLWRRTKPLRRGDGEQRTFPSTQREKCWCGGELEWFQWHPHYAVCDDCGCYVNRQPSPPEARIKQCDPLESTACWLSLIERYGSRQGRVMGAELAPGAVLAELQKRGFECVHASSEEGFSVRDAPACKLFLSFETAEYAADPLVFWKQAACMLRPGGIALLQTAVGIWGSEQPVSASADFFDPSGHPFVHTLQSIRKLTDLAGLELVAVEEISRGTSRVCILRKPASHHAARAE